MLSRETMGWLIVVLGAHLVAWDPFKGANSDVKDGNSAVAKGEFQSALEAFDRAGAKHRNHAVVWFNRGIALAGLKRFDEAKEEFAKAANALSEAKDRTDATYNGGTALVDLARATTRKADDKDVPVSATDRLKHVERAIYELTKALKMRPGDADAKWNIEVALRVEEQIRREIEREEEEKEKVEEGECLAGQLFVAPAAGKEEALKALDGALEPEAKTPLAQALGFLAGLKTVAAKGHRTAVVLVTDGMDTCGGDGATGVDAIARAGAPTLVVGFAKGADAAKLNEMKERGRVGWKAAQRVYRAAEVPEIVAAVKELAPVLPLPGSTPPRARTGAPAPASPSASAPVSPSAPAPDGPPDTAGVPRDRLPLQVIVVLDRSQSMRHKGKWADAKKLAEALLKETWPEGVSVGLMIFPWDDREKESGECGPAQVVVEPAEKTAQKIREAIAPQKPAEKTALGAALQQAAGVKALADKGAKSVAVLITDGVDTCGGKPEESITELTKLGVQTAVLGFPGASDERMLAELARRGGFADKALAAGVDDVALTGAQNILIILDRSESMSRQGRWEKARVAVESILTRYGDSARIGLVGFPWGKPEDKKEDKKDDKKDQKDKKEKDQKQDQKKDQQDQKDKDKQQQKKEPKQDPADKNVPQEAKKQQDAAQKIERPLKLAPLRQPPGGGARPPSRYTW